MNMLNVDDVKWVEDNMEDIKKISSQASEFINENTEQKIEEEAEKNTAWSKMKLFVRKAVDCCIE